MRRTVSLAVLVTLATASPGLQALGLAEPEVNSSLSEPLRARIALSDLGGLDPSHLRVRLADAEAFGQAGMSRSALAESVQMALSTDAGQLSVVLSTDKPVNEPYLDLLLALEWPDGTLRRQVTLLLDPPGYAGTAALIDNGQHSSGKTSKVAQATSLPSASPVKGKEHLPVAPVGQSRRIEVKPGDTLWRIAERVSRPAGVSVEQVMMALFRTNQAAFPGGNINSLRAGAVLDVPADERLMAEVASNAHQQVSQQNRAWRSSGRDDMASGVVETPRLTLLSDIELAAETAASDSNDAQMPLDSQTAVATGTSAESSEPPLDEAARLAALEANWQSSRKALAEMRIERDRLQDEIVSLREDMASLRELLSQSVAAAPAKDAVEPAQPVAAASSTAAASSVPLAQANSAVSAADGRTDRSGLWQRIRQGIADQASLIGGGAIALLLLVWAILRRRSQREPDDAGMDYSFQQAMGDSGIPDFVEKVPAPVPVSTASPTESAPQAETINEADIFIAYGRYEQASELLEKSLESEPERHDLRLKLLLAYTELGRRDAAEREAAQLLERTDGDYRSEIDRLMARFESDDGQPDKAQEAAASEDPSRHLLDEAKRIEGAVDSVVADVERIIDYKPPSLEPEHESRHDALQRPGIDIPEFPGLSSSTGRDDAEWDIEEVAFEPLNLDNDRPTTDTSKIKPAR
ncbi:tetratricopeptide repeat protein [Halomonas sp. McH1-25]|uniref:type IV pilus assembly protein FimV n=3 Tax=Halomonas TaxID=2745 RepID=UPI001EF4BF19|nr:MULTISPECIES: FimV/HubP family polar landmark protein [unclassified Halomonas]MCG7599156.1 tetratricopeptide repeat protein [Halomonas sp. McH1-25]MCP1344554.1 tetratricopeptide repeat protein [Halomonas sp. FL8]